MLYQKSDSSLYVQEFKRKFSNFADKAPILISYTTTPTGVQVINETTSLVYEFSWDFTIPVKSFIHGIKQILVENCYPILEKLEEIEEDLSEEDQIKLASEGTPLDEIPTKCKIGRYHKYLIDKCIIIKDIFLLKDLETDRMYRYQMNKSSVFFLQKMRSGKLNPAQAAEYFFKNTTLLNEVVLLEGNQADEKR
jgi:hypothetical protein